MEKIFYNGKIITMTGSLAEAVLVGSGRIKKVGTLDSVRQSADKDAEWMNLQGRCMMPSFIDSHSHIVRNGQAADFADLTGCGSFGEIVSALKNHAKEQKEKNGRVIIGFGYDHNFLEERKHPDKFVLDKVSADIPVAIFHISAHMGCFSSAALKMCGINERTDSPKGGAIGRICGGSEPNGYIEENGLALVQGILQGNMDLNQVSVTAQMQKAYIENGITTAQDGASTESDLKFLKRMADLHKLKIDVVSYPLLTAGGAELPGQYKTFDRKYKNHLKIGGCKIILDGSPQGRSAWLSEPYLEGQTGYCGYPALEDDVAKQYIARALKAGRQILAHCNGDAASEQFLNIYEECMEDVQNAEGLRPVMVHCQTVRNDQLSRMAKLQMIASMFIGHIWYWGDIHVKNLGQERAGRISPALDAFNRGVVVNFHQDTPVTKPDMLHSVWCAVNRVKRGKGVLGENQRISVYEALKAVTINAAYQYFEENEKGSIEEGKRADLVILDESPLEIDAFNIKDIQILETIKDGITIYKK